MLDPDLELRGGGGGRGVAGLDLLAMAAIFPSVISSFFTQNRGGGGAGSPGPSPRSATDKERDLISSTYEDMTMYIKRILFMNRIKASKLSYIIHCTCKGSVVV